MVAHKTDASRLLVPCAYQGGKQRIAPQVVDHMLEVATTDEDTVFYDLCCGSGAVTVELLNRGVSPSRILMLDISSWGVFWGTVGDGSFSLELLSSYLEKVPQDKEEIHAFATKLAQEDASVDECYRYLLLQACSFGGKQIWRDGTVWRNAFFRKYWMPTPTSVRRSPANPMQPGPDELYARIEKIVSVAEGVRCVCDDIGVLLDEEIPRNSVIYIDPPYDNTTNYGFSFDVLALVQRLQSKGLENIFVSEGTPISEDAVRLHFGGPKGGISGCKKARHQEWISVFGCISSEVEHSALEVVSL